MTIKSIGNDFSKDNITANASTNLKCKRGPVTGNVKLSSKTLENPKQLNDLEVALDYKLKKPASITLNTKWTPDALNKKR